MLTCENSRRRQESGKNVQLKKFEGFGKVGFQAIFGAFKNKQQKYPAMVDEERNLENAILGLLITSILPVERKMIHQKQHNRQNLSQNAF